MASMPIESHLEWAANALGTSSEIRTVEALHDGSSPWLLVIDDGATRHEVILRVTGWIPPHAIATAAAALRVAADHGLATPRLIAADLDGHITGAPATLETALPGSAPPRTVSEQRLPELGAALARVHAVHLDPTDDLPLRLHHTPGDDHPMERRWANLYRASTPGEQPAVTQALSELTGWPIEHSERMMQATASSPLLQVADDRIRAMDRPAGASVFLHGDTHPGNMLWNGETYLLIDWKSAGIGDPGVDLGNLRMQMAIKHGPDAAEQVLQGWQAEAGRQASNLAYWDVMAALHTSAVLFPGLALDGQGERLDPPAETQRRDQFLRTALDQLKPSNRIPRFSRYV